MAQISRVLVFGTSNVGKTSMLNELTGQSHPVSSGPSGTTFQTVQYELVDHKSISYLFFDTAGLHEVSGGTISSEVAFENLFDLLTKSQDGFNLLIFVMRSGTILQSDKATYDMFVNKMTEQHISVVGVITSCETEQHMPDYAAQHKDTYEQRGMKFKKLVSTCFAKGGPLEEAYAPLRKESREVIWEAIENSASATPYVFIKNKTSSFTDTCKRVWNSFCDSVGHSKWKVIRSQEIYETLGRMGITDEKRKRELAERFAQTK